MKKRDLFYISIRSILRSPSKIIMPALAVAIGTASVILISSIGKGTASEAERQFDMLGVDGLCLSVNDGSFDTDSIEKITDNIKNIENTTLFDYVEGYASAHQRRRKALIFGTGPEPCTTLGIELICGRDIEESDTANHENVVVVGEEYALFAYERTDIVGKTIKLSINGISDSYEVIGVVRSQTERFKTMLGIDPGSIVYIPYTVLNDKKFASGAKNIAIKLISDADSDKTASEILKYIKRTEPQNTGYVIENISSYLSKVREIINTASLLITAVGSISLIVAVLGVMNVEFAGLEKQKYEIGLLLSIGALEKHIRSYVRIQTVCICMIGGLFGIIVSIIAGFILKNYSIIPFEFDFIVVLISEILSFICGMAAGVIPSYKAASMEPVDALRSS